jgi:hypothetical protein
MNGVSLGWTSLSLQLEAKTISGTHQPDTWMHLNTKLLTVGKGNVMPDWPVCHLDATCRKCPAIDVAHTARLADNVKSASTEVPDDGVKVSSNEKDEFLHIMEKATVRMHQSQDEFKSHRQI